jgi:hypothetical protein
LFSHILYVFLEAAVGQKSMAMAAMAEKPLNDLLSHSMVDIYVGPENTHWVLHEKLLCSRSQFFSKIFYTKTPSSRSGGNKAFGLPDEEDEPFRLFVGWLYSSRIAAPDEEKELGSLLDLYLMGEKWQIASLVKDVLDAVRRFYRLTESYPGLRRVQYIYANTDEDSPMRQLLVSSVARQLVLAESLPAHWNKALRKNGELAVDLIQAVQAWKLDAESVPDARIEATELEAKKVEGVEVAEKHQQGIPKGEQGGDDDEASDDKNVKHPTNGINRLTNGVS